MSDYCPSYEDVCNWRIAYLFDQTLTDNDKLKIEIRDGEQKKQNKTHCFWSALEFLSMEQKKFKVKVRNDLDFCWITKKIKLKLMIGVES